MEESISTEQGKKMNEGIKYDKDKHCLLYTSDAADDLLCVDLGGRRNIKKKKKKKKTTQPLPDTHRYKFYTPT